MVGAGGDEVGASDDASQHDEVEGGVLRHIVGGIPHGGASVHVDADVEGAQVVLGQVGESGGEAVLHNAAAVGLGVDGFRLIDGAHGHLLAVDGDLLGNHRGGDAALVGDAHHGVGGYLGHALLRVNVIVALGHADGQVVGVVLPEERVLIDVLVG